MAGKAIHGLNAVREALRTGHGVNRVYFAKESRAHGAAELIAEVRAARIPFDFVPQAKLNELADTREHQGVVALVSPKDYTPLEDCLAQCTPKAILLVLDQVQHPKNLGMLVRTAAGAGASGVLLTARGGALLDDTVLRASAGMIFRVPIVLCANLAQTLRALTAAGFWVYGLDAEGPENVFTLPWADRCALVVGNESEGLRPTVRKACDALVRIPLAAGADSLNVSVAAGIAMFQVAAAHEKAASRREP
ncbi:MAG: 23S rRNA (guanosine(2251)-2'-O)-methyltransferase RlmB [Candidatus Hydrogenedentes bacterium]|nr:23S rRNA (guanosine(2251)-2'-O)-methyltransferase RlmB [Candidatus Hydrogenedentota bacterium]